MKIAVSILDVDFSQLAKQISRVEKGGPDFFHLDIMDGHFVPNISFGPGLVRTIRRFTSVPLESHLMISEPLKFIEPFVQAGSDLITVHLEANQFRKALKKIHSCGIKAGIALNPGTPVEALRDVAKLVDLILIMSVHPGFGGQSFIPRTLGRLRQLRKLIEVNKLNCQVEVDGGINFTNAREIISAGADILAVGSYISRAKNPLQRLRQFRKRLQPRI